MGCEQRLRRSVSWRSAALLALGAALLVLVSIGPMAGEIGTATPWVWLAIASVGALQCLLLSALAVRYPNRAGGTPMYVHAVLGRRRPLLAAISSWGYWFAWTPGIAVNLILAATYLRATVLPGLDILPLAIALGVALYAVNGLGLEPSMRLAGCLACVALVPLGLATVGLLLQPSLIDLDRLVPVAVDTSSGSPALLLVAKWAFVAAWSAYGAEMASTIVAEMKAGAEEAPWAMHVAAVIGLVGFGLMPFLIVAVTGVAGLSADPLVAFLPFAEAIGGDAGKTAVGLLLASALILGAQAFVVGSSRTIFQMAHDGYIPRAFATVNRRQVPIGSLTLDGMVIFALLALFGTRVVDVVAAANFGYVVVFVLMPVAFLLVRLSEGGSRARWTSPLNLLAVGLMLFNAALLVVGGTQWGSRVVLAGVIVMSLIVPISLFRRWQDRRAGYPALPPLFRGQPVKDGLQGAGR
ncbi:MAG TPA: APC family permease [Solirubrobacterales bacterium]|nr:APC family permease [Solirubrobacterales bacterium]